jgi:mRNA-degrading endonuclease RelE of RelBE toxin-antitoxin system
MGARESSPPRPPPETPKPASKELERKNPLSDSDQKRLSKRISDVLANNTALNHRVQSTTANNVGKRRLSISSSVRLIKEALENLGVLTIMKDEMAKIVNSEEFSDISFFISSQKRCVHDFPRLSN